MRRGEETQVTNMAGIRRNLKNLAHNYSYAQVKVREATSNDPWGPSSTLMSEIADLTYNVVAFTEIMQMIWKRLNDHGKNWRHVYKALVLLDYLIKTGSEKVAQQCRENIFAILTLRDFQYMDDGKDQGLNVREKAKQLVTLLRDEERLRAERARALKAKERFAQSHSTTFPDSDTLDSVSPSSPTFSNSRSGWSTDMDRSTPVGGVQNGVRGSVPEAALDLARPQTAGEEELQLQLALAMSREEAEQEEQKRRSDDVRLQLALSQSENEFKSVATNPRPMTQQKKPTSHLEDLLDVSLGAVAPSGPAGATSLASPPSTDPWGMPIHRPQVDPWSSVGSAGSSSTPDPWSPLPAKTSQGGSAVRGPEGRGPWGDSSAAPPADPWSPLSPGSPPTSPPPPDPLDDFLTITNRNINNNNNNTSATTSGGSPNPFEMSGLGESLVNGSGSKRRSPHSFLGENSALVNLDQLVTKPPAAPALAPFSPPQPTQPISSTVANPFSGVVGSGRPMAGPQPLQPPLIPGPPTANPFLS